MTLMSGAYLRRHGVKSHLLIRRYEMGQTHTWPGTLNEDAK